MTHHPRAFNAGSPNGGPDTMGEPEIAAFLSHLATVRNVSASTQNQALHAILFLYRHVLSRPLGFVPEIAPARRPVRLPVVLSQAEVKSILVRMRGIPRLCGTLMYGSGLRVSECLALRIKDIDIGRREILERVSGMTYENYVKTAVLAPAGITKMQIGRTRLSERATNEVKYYHPGAETVNVDLLPSVFRGEGLVPSIYGGFHLEAMDAHGGSLASAIDLARFGAVADGRPTPPDIISPESIIEMTHRNPQVFPPGTSWYGLGWAVRSPPQDNWQHGGSLPGTISLLVRSYHGFTWAAVFNARAANLDLVVEVDKALWNALAGVSAFPSHDLFTRFQ